MVLPSAPQSATLLWLQQLLPGLFTTTVQLRASAQRPSAAHVINQNESEWIRMNQMNQNALHFDSKLLQTTVVVVVFIHAASMTNMQELYIFFVICATFTYIQLGAPPLYLYSPCESMHPARVPFSKATAVRFCRRLQWQSCCSRPEGRCNGHISIRKQCVRMYSRSHWGLRRLCNEGGTW